MTLNAYDLNAHEDEGLVWSQYRQVFSGTDYSYRIEQLKKLKGVRFRFDDAFFPIPTEMEVREQIDFLEKDLEQENISNFDDE